MRFDFPTITAIVGTAIMLALLVDQWMVARKAKRQPPAVRVSPELLAQLRSEIVHHAMKRKVVRADFQRGYRR